jgi:hypothetical protein
MNISKVVDFRVLKNQASKGLVASCIGLSFTFDHPYFLCDAEWQCSELKMAGVSDDRIMNFFSFFKLLMSGEKLEVIAPIQRPKVDTIILKVLGYIKLSTCVHDLFYRSNQKLLKMEFQSYFFLLKRLIYDITIKNVDEIYAFSKIVERQIKIVFKRTAVKIDNKKLLPVRTNYGDRGYDFYVILSNRKYKGFWKINDIRFPKGSVVAINENYRDRINFGDDIDVVLIDDSDEEHLASYQNSKCVVAVSRYEGFGFVPFEAGYYGAIPIILNCSAMIELPSEYFIKLRLTETVLKAPNYYREIINPDLNKDYYTRCIVEINGATK